MDKETSWRLLAARRVSLITAANSVKKVTLQAEMLIETESCSVPTET